MSLQDSTRIEKLEKGYASLHRKLDKVLLFAAQSRWSVPLVLLALGVAFWLGTKF